MSALDRSGVACIAEIRDDDCRVYRLERAAWLAHLAER
jgi:hypothetical protein